MRARAVVVTLALVGPALGWVGGCKRNRAPPVQEVWDEEPVPDEAEAIGNLAPPWPAPVRGQLDNGLLTFWLHEADTVALHVRVLVPTTAHDDPPSAEASAAIAEHLQSELAKRTKRYDATVAVVHAPDRFEVSISARNRDVAGILAALGTVMAARPTAALDAARDRVTADLEMPRAVDVAAEAVLSALLDHGDRVDVGRTRGLSRGELTLAWETLTDPRGLVLLVHSGSSAEDAKTDLRKLASQWRGLGKRVIEAQAVDRLRRKAPEPSKARILGEPAATLAVARTKTQGSAHLVLGRIIATPDSRTRSVARLAQRVAQEDIDVSIAFAGKHAVLLVHAPLGAKPEARAREVVAKLTEIAKTRQPRQRLFQATQLWLGARVVEASLSGEDWTALFASASELADRDADIAPALARDAQQMLDVDADALLAWTKTWLDPRGGTPGWTWAVAGASESDVRALAAITRTHEVGR